MSGIQSKITRQRSRKMWSITKKKIKRKSQRMSKTMKLTHKQTNKNFKAATLYVLEYKKENMNKMKKEMEPITKNRCL